MVDLFLSYHIPEDYVFQAVEGALGQDYQDYHLHIVDDATGTDFNQKIYDRYHRYRDKISFYANPERIGFYASVNRCFWNFRGEMFFVCDSDDISMPWRVSDALKVYRRENFDFYSACARWIKYDGSPTDSYCIFKEVTFDENGDFDGRIYNPTTAIRNSFFKDINGYSNCFVGGDKDFVLKAYFYGAKFSYDRRIAVLRRMHNNQVTRTPELGMKSGRRDLIHKRMDWRTKNIYATGDKEKIRDVGMLSLTSGKPAVPTC
jgi:glycosyltransferase involved in cell wall biosynthesis